MGRLLRLRASRVDEGAVMIPTWIDLYVPAAVGDVFALYQRGDRWHVALDSAPGPGRVLVRVVKVRRQSSGAVGAKVERCPS